MLSAIQFTGKGGPIGAGVLFLLSFPAVFVSPFILKLVLPGDVHSLRTQLAGDQSPHGRRFSRPQPEC